MKPANINIDIYQGATFSKRFWYGTKVDPDGPDPDPIADINWQPYDLSGASARMQVRQRIEDATPLMDLDDSTITVGDLEGWVLVEATAVQTAAFDFDPDPVLVGKTSGTGVYDLEVEFADGRVIRLAEGTANLHPEVTR
jgi:hypothetical protein